MVKKRYTSSKVRSGLSREHVASLNTVISEACQSEIWSVTHMRDICKHIHTLWLWHFALLEAFVYLTFSPDRAVQDLFVCQSWRLKGLLNLGRWVHGAGLIFFNFLSQRISDWQFPVHKSCQVSFLFSFRWIL